MRSLVISVILFIIMIGFFIFDYSYLVYVTNDMTYHLESVDSLAENEKWEQAEIKMNDVMKKWEQRKELLFALSNHVYVDDISESLLRAKERIKERDTDEVSLEIELSKMLFLSIPEKEKPSIANIF